MHLKNFLSAIVIACCSICNIHGSVLISGIMADPASYDNVYEYVQFMTSERIDFSETPYTVIICNNGTILHPSGWLTGSTLTYAIQLDSGVVEMGETFYIGGPTPKLNGPNSEDIHLKNWFAIDCTAQDGAGGIGLKQQWRIGMVGNGGPSADGIAVFAGKAEDLTEESVPLDCVFYGDAVGDAAAYQYRLTDGTLLDEEDDIYPSPGKECLMKFEGVYNYLEDKWVVERTSFSVPSFTEEDFKPAIKLIPYVFDVEVSSTPCEECITWKSILPDTTRFAVLWQEDSSAGCSAYPTTICGMPDSLPEGLSLLEFSTEKNLCSANAPMAQHLVAIYPMENGCIDTLGCDLGLHIAQATLRETTTSHLQGCLGDTTLYLAEGRDSVWVELPTPQFDNPCNRFHLTSTFQPDSFAPGTYTFDFALRNDSAQVVDQCATLVHVIDTTPPVTPDTTPTIVDTIPPVVPDTTPTIVDTIPPIVPDTTPTVVDTIPPVVPDTTPTIVDTIPPIVPDTTPMVVDTIPPIVPDTTPTIVDTIPPIVPDTTPAVVDTIPPVVPDTTPTIVDTIPPIVPDTTPTIVDTIPPIVPDTTPTIVDTIPSIMPDTTPAVVDTIPPVVTDTTPAIVDTIPPVVPDTTTTIVDTIPPIVQDTTSTIVDTIPPIVPDTTPTVVDTIPSIVQDTTPTIVDTIPPVVPDTTPAIVDTIPSIVSDTTPTIVDTIPPIVQDTTPTVVDTIPPIVPDTTPIIADTIPPIVQDSTPTIVDTIPPIVPDTTPTVVDTIPPVVPDTTPAIVDTIPPIVPDTTPAIVDTIPPIVPDTTPAIVDTIPPVVPDTTTTIVDTIPPIVPDTTPAIVDTTPPIVPDTTPAVVDTIPPVVPDTTPAIIDTIPSVVTDTTPTIVDTIPPIVPDTTPAIVDTIPPVVPDTTPTVVDTIPPIVPDTTPALIDTLPELVEEGPSLPTDTTSEAEGNGKAKELTYNLLLTPNGDGINDRLEIESLSQYPDNEIYIYNKWGIQVFHMKHYDNHWGGDNHNGFSLGGRKLLPVGTYYYLLLSQGSKALSGFIELSY